MVANSMRRLQVVRQIPTPHLPVVHAEYLFYPARNLVYFAMEHDLPGMETNA